jgi:hypothetical protein
MDEDELTIFDVKRCILTGDIVDKQKDPDTKEWKYLVKGHSISGDEVITVTKLAPTLLSWSGNLTLALDMFERWLSISKDS